MPTDLTHSIKPVMQRSRLDHFSISSRWQFSINLFTKIRVSTYLFCLSERIRQESTLLSILFHNSYKADSKFTELIIEH